MTDPKRLGAVVLTDDPAFAEAVRELFAATLPSLDVEVAEPAVVRPPADAAAIVLDARAERGGARAKDALLRIRATGFLGPLALVVDGPDAVAQGFASRLGARVVVRALIARELPSALAGHPDDRDPVTTAIRSDLSRTRRLIAAGEIALGLQHALNNPLTALLAESQLLEMDALEPEQLQAVRRILELCRRTILLVRQLDGVSDARERAASVAARAAATSVAG